ncbi:hypothetical protein PINS_up022221 [Pythium insidiosum]|nr:hypothetical protein PINS_up022221 [Pythium insidiosum]
MAVGIFGGCVGVIRIVRDMLPHVSTLVVRVLAPSQAEALTPSQAQTLEQSLLWGVFAVVVLPLCALRSLSGLQIPNAVGFFFSLVLVGAVVYRALTVDGDNTTDATSATSVTSDAVADAFQLSRLAQSVSIYSYAFTMHLNLLPLFVQLRGNCEAPIVVSTRRMTRVIAGVTALCAALYVAFGVAASTLYGDATRGNVLVNMSRDAFMQLPLVAVFITVLVSFPPLFHPGRCIVQELVNRRPAPELGARSRVTTAALLLLAELLVALWVPGIEVVFALVGASTTVLICYVFPVVMSWALVPWRASLRGRVMCAALWGVVAFVAVMGIQTIAFLLFPDAKASTVT